MSQIAAIAQSLLRGEVLSIMDGFKNFGCSNIPREISRSIEQKFDVIVTKTPHEFTSRYGHKGRYFKYRLPMIKQNEAGIEKMKIYVKENKYKTA